MTQTHGKNLPLADAVQVPNVQARTAGGEPETSAAYPAYREADIVLRDGSTVHVRPVRPDDESALLQFFNSLSIESRALRFFSAATDVSRVARDESHVDYTRTFGLVATAGIDGHIVGHAYYACQASDAHRAELALAVADRYQGNGLGTILLGQLVEAGAAHGIRVFEALALPANTRLVEVLRESGLPVELHADRGVLEVRLPVEFNEVSLQRFEYREQIAAVNALKKFLNPRSIAVIGASRNRGTVGGEAFHNLLESGFKGPIFPVNANASVVQSVIAYPTVEAISEPVDLAVVAVPAERVVDVAEQCGRKGVRALLVLSAGFAECGPEGRARQAELVRMCRATGMRLIGPNCIGIINTDPTARLNATFGPLAPPPGRIGFASQSGALGLAAIQYAADLSGLGISSFVSLGNRADISTNDLLNYWESDPRTDLILLYVESFGNPRKFGRIARRVGRSKPIVAVKSGRSPAGARATSTHTGALLAASDITVDALFQQCGVIRTDTLEELIDAASLLVNQPLPRGSRVGIVTNVGGPAILCADTCEARGLSVPLLSEATQTSLRSFLPAEASPANPVDMVASATAEEYERAVELVAADSNVDAVIAIFIQPLITRAEEVAAALARVAGRMQRDKPLLSVFVGLRGGLTAFAIPEGAIPCYTFPESAGVALAHAAHYAAWRARPYVPPPELADVRRTEAAELVERALERCGGCWLDPDEVYGLLSCYGVHQPRQRLAGSPAEAAAAAAELDGPVALKGVAPGLVHKTEVGAVQLRLESPELVGRAASDMTQRLLGAEYPNATFLIQEMVPHGVEMLVGVVHDAQFGPVVACGAGGVTVEILGDMGVRLTPVTRDDAHEVVTGLKSYPLLTGYRGAPMADVGALEDLVVRIGALADDLPQVAELDCNPVVVLEHGAVVVDARIRVAPVEPAPPIGARAAEG
jgi:acetyl coenzyme A synthetase (ADP forming)-like protein